MRWIASAFVAAGVLDAQQAMPVGIVHGNLISSAGGSLSVRQSDGAVYDCSYDNHTLFQRNLWPIRSTDLNGGEPVEVLSDRSPARACYVRMLSVVSTPPKSPRRQAPPRDSWVPHGYLTYSGRVVESAGSKITLQTRAGLRTLLLRPDTHYSDATETLINKHVFVRAGRTPQGALEAYQVMWSAILTGNTGTVHSFRPIKPLGIVDAPAK
jgi:hypothetical protein